MRIGIDGGCWANRRGYGRFLRELLEALGQAGGGHEYVVFLEPTAYREFHLNGCFQGVQVSTSKALGGAATADGRRSLSDLLRMSRAVSREHLDLFFFSSVYSYFPLLSRVRTVVGVHDTIADKNPQFAFASRRQEFFWRGKVKLALAQADMVLTVSEYSRRCIERNLKVPRRKIRVIQEAASARFRKIESAPSPWRYVLYVGGISPNKNLPMLLKAYAATQARASGVKLMLVGDYVSDGFKSSYLQLRDLITALGLEEQVVFTGYVPDDELVRIYNGASAFAMPSLEEGFGLPAIEAMACGIPVIVSSGNSLAEVVGDAGLIVDPENKEQLANAIDRVIGEDGLARELTARGLSRAAEYSWQGAAKTLLSVFEETAVRGRVNTGNL